MSSPSSNEEAYIKALEEEYSMNSTSVEPVKLTKEQEEALGGWLGGRRRRTRKSRKCGRRSRKSRKMKCCKRKSHRRHRR